MSYGDKNFVSAKEIIPVLGGNSGIILFMKSTNNPPCKL